MKIAITALFSCILSTCLTTRATETHETLTNVIQVLQAVHDRSIGQRFMFKARVAATSSDSSVGFLSVSDGSGFLLLKPNPSIENVEVHGGDLVTVRGYVDLSQATPVCARLARIQVLAHGDPPEPVAIPIADLLSGAYDNRPVTVSGNVRDIFFDDIDPRNCILVLETAPHRLQVVFPSNNLDEKQLDSYLNAQVSISGICNPSSFGTRLMSGRHLIAKSAKDINILKNSEDSLFDRPNLDDLTSYSGEKIASMGRQRVFGKVLATWGDCNFLVKYFKTPPVRVELAHGPLPRYGMKIEAVGFPETDLFGIRLSRAVWRDNEPSDTTLEPAQVITANDIFRSTRDRKHINMLHNGQVVTMRGIVSNASRHPGNANRIFIETGGVNIPVDLSAHPHLIANLPVGSKIAVTGICIVDIETWKPNAILPRINGMFLVPRIPEDIKVLSKPSWWTPGRLTITTGTLLAIVIVILLWNTSLRRQVEKRSHELTMETVALISSEMKVNERTRLAMELHDSIVQNLTGVSMEIRTADHIADDDSTGMHQHLSLAIKTLDSCRKDLRNCLWDLRNLTLDDEDVNEAIRRTLVPHIGNTELSIRFNVPRDQFCDNTAHTILRIIRELAINSIQHGKASSLKVADSIEGGKLLFSVTDNGCGFDPQNAPGMAQGHFGLQGIRDRIESFDGDIDIQSTRGKGTKVTISLSIPKEVGNMIA